MEDEDEDYKLCHKLTEAHVKNFKKMKVSIATQTFSKRVAAVTKCFARNGIPIPSTAQDIAEFILFINNIFDSVNGSSIRSKDHNKYRCAVIRNSEHMKFWGTAIKVFESMTSFNKKKKRHVPPSLRNWIHTLKAFRYM
ncbi:hypothetical protein QE152_g39266 [Popillia japonica]|uniref:Transposable element P transposase-like GTP-binding insertion domain-containing protein n=1 Tax=Popillia japonica TaxID=7064 RepID=A0AAW1HUL7_POPJA